VGKKIRHKVLSSYTLKISYFKSLLLIMTYCYSTTGKLPGSRAGRKAEDKRGSEPIQEQVSAQETETKSWTLDNVTEIVYLATQLQMTQRLDEACEGLEQGDKNALVVCTALPDMYSYIHKNALVVSIVLPLYLVPNNI